MKKLLIVILCLVLNSAYAEIVRVIYHPDGKASIIIPVKENHTTEDFNSVMERDPNLKGLPYEDMDRSELPLNPDGTKKDRDCWVKNPNGKGVIIDQAKKAQKEQKEIEKKNKEKALENKLKDLGLTQEEVNSLLK